MLPSIFTIWQALQPLLTTIGALLVGGGAVTTLAYWIFKTFASKWLDNRFAKELEEFRHKHQTELQRLKLEIDALLDRTIKLHGREFETLPQAWSLLDDAFHSVLSTSLAFMQYANLELMTEPQLEEFLQHEELPNWKKDELRRVSDKNKVYSDALQWKALNRADRMRQEFHSYILKNGIFFLDSIRLQFLEINTMMIAASVERQIALQSPNAGSTFDSAQRLHGEGRKLLEKLQGEIHERLWSSARQAGK